jgi:hypothetical protein
LFVVLISKREIYCDTIAPSENFANKFVLANPNEFILYWNYTHTDILFEIHVKTTGWAGFGLSPNGGMDGSDVVIIRIDSSSGSFNFTDRHIVGRSVLIDQVQNWIPLLLTTQGEYLIAKFTRKIKICDETNEDMDITEGTPYVIFAYGANLVNGDITYHDFRGSKTLPLISSLNSEINLDMSKVVTTDFRVNVSREMIISDSSSCRIIDS